MSRVEVAIGINEQRPRFAGEIHEHLHVAGALSSVGEERVGQVGWNLKGIRRQTGDLNSTHTAVGKRQRFPNRDRACRKQCARKIQALRLMAAGRINQRQGETADR